MIDQQVYESSPNKKYPMLPRLKQIIQVQTSYYKIKKIVEIGRIFVITGYFEAKFGRIGSI